MLVGLYWLDQWMKFATKMSAAGSGLPALANTADGSSTTSLPKKTPAEILASDAVETLTHDQRIALIEHALAAELASMRAATDQERLGLADQIDTLKATVSDAIAHAEKQRDALTKQVATTTAELEQTKKDAAQAAAAANDKIAAATSENDRLKADLSALRTEIDQAKKAAATAASAASEKLTAATSESDRLKSELSASKEKLSVLQKSTSNEIASLKRSLVSAEDSRAKAESQVTVLSGERQSAADTLAKVRADAADAKKRLEAEVAELTAKLKSTEASLAAASAAATVSSPASVAEPAPAAPAKARTTVAASRAKKEKKASTAAESQPVIEPEPIVETQPTPASGLQVGFKKPGDWGQTVYVHYCHATPPTPDTIWPGVPMTLDASGWHVLDLPGIETAVVVFNDGVGHQTGDLYRDCSGWLDSDGFWYDPLPRSSS